MRLDPRRARVCALSIVLEILEISATAPVCSRRVRGLGRRGRRLPLSHQAELFHEASEEPPALPIRGDVAWSGSGRLRTRCDETPPLVVEAMLRIPVRCLPL